MRNIIALLAVATLATHCSRDKATNENTSKTDSVKSTSEKVITTDNVLKEELPPAKTCKLNLGKLKMSDDGYSLGKKTELTELLKQVKNKDCDIIEIVYVWETPPYDDMPMKINYNRREGRLKEIYTQRNVIEDYTNITDACLTSFLRGGEKDFGSLSNYCKDVNHDFNNREMNQITIGPKPGQSELDGSVKIVKDYIKENAKDASSIE